MIEFHCSNSYVENLLEDYWKSDDAGNFIHTQKYLLSKYAFKTLTALETTIKKNSYGFINKKNYSCPECNEPHKFFLRKELKDFFKRYSLICEICTVKRTEQELISNYNYSINSIIKFNKIYDANLYNKYCTSYDGVEDKLNYLELIYLYVILNNNKINYLGKLGAKKFPLFLHEEYYQENEILKKIFKKSLLFYTLGSKTKESIDFINFYKKFYNKKISLETTKILNEIEDKKTDLFNIIFKPKNLSFNNYKAYLFECIKKHSFSFSDLENISFFLQHRRKMEILFLSSVIKYNTDFKLSIDNSVEFKLDSLKESYSLKEIYGYFNSSVNATLYKMDSFNDNQRKTLKNKIYNNIFKSENKINVFEKKLPRNYRKSSILKFIEEHYELDCVWEDTPVNEFIGIFFNKLKLLGKIAT